MMSEPAVRRRIERAAMELRGNVAEPMPPHVWVRQIGAAMDGYLGPSLGMTVTDRWHALGAAELETLCEAIDERAAIVGWS